MKTRDAEEILLDSGWGNSPMPYFKLAHCIETGYANAKIAKQCGLDVNHAEVVGLLHDIGCHHNRGVRHTLIGYKHLLGLGLPENIASVNL